MGCPGCRRRSFLPSSAPGLPHPLGVRGPPDHLAPGPPVWVVLAVDADRSSRRLRQACPTPWGFEVERRRPTNVCPTGGQAVTCPHAHKPPRECLGVMWTCRLHPKKLLHLLRRLSLKLNEPPVVCADVGGRVLRLASSAAITRPPTLQGHTHGNRNTHLNNCCNCHICHTESRLNP